MKKLKELILYISEICQDDPEFGATKLNKILFVADFFAYSVFGKSITGEKYFHLPKGPAPRQMKKAQEDLISKERARIIEKPYFGRIQKRLVPLRGPNTSIFEQEELDLIKDVIDSMSGLTGTQLSTWTHSLIPWLLTEEKEEIPYFTAHNMRSVPVRKDGLIWAEKELEKLRESGYEV